MPPGPQDLPVYFWFSFCNGSGTDKYILFILDGEKELLKKEFEAFNRYIFVNNDKNEILDVMNSRSIKKYNNMVYGIIPRIIQEA